MVEIIMEQSIAASVCHCISQRRARLIWTAVLNLQIIGLAGNNASWLPLNEAGKVF